MRRAIVLLIVLAGCAVDDPTLRTDIDPTIPPDVVPIVEPPSGVEPIVEPPGAL